MVLDKPGNCVSVVPESLREVHSGYGVRCFANDVFVFIKRRL